MYLALFIYVNAIICKQERVAKTWNGNTFSIKHIEAEKSRRYFLQTIFSNSFSWMKTVVFRFHFTEIGFQGFSWQYASIGSNCGLAPNRRQDIILTNEDFVFIC